MTPRWVKIVKEYSEALIIAFILAMIIRTFFIQAFKIPSGSMLDTLLIGDHLLVNKIGLGVKVPFTDILLLRFDDPEHEDVIVFEFPEDSSKDFIKRVIGVPGDTIEVRNKDVYRNGEKLTEPYAQHTDSHVIPGSPRDNMPPVTMPEDSYFVMGDNRDESYDSRFWGFVTREKVKGTAFIIYWSWQGPTEIRFGRIGTLVR